MYIKSAEQICIIRVLYNTLKKSVHKSINLVDNETQTACNCTTCTCTCIRRPVNEKRLKIYYCINTSII